MAEIVNLRQVRKRRARNRREADAAENRVRFGRPPEQVEREAEAESRGNRLLDASRIDPSPEEQNS